MNLFFDTETTGFWKFNDIPISEEQPHLLQIAWVLEDDKGRTLNACSALLAQNIWPGLPLQKIEPRATECHHITDEMAKNYGVPPQMILNELRRVISASKRIVAHNIKFDVGVLKKLCHVMKEPMPVLPEQYCTMQESKNVCKIPTANGSGYKWPKLAEAYFYFAKKQLNGAHDALVDVYGCRTVYRGLQKLKEE